LQFETAENQTVEENQTAEEAAPSEFPVADVTAGTEDDNSGDDTPRPEGGAQVVRLDRFRKK
jgi:hypothetical protein